MHEVIVREMAGPKEHLKYYDKYKDLISKKVIEPVYCLYTLTFVTTNPHNEQHFQTVSKQRFGLTHPEEVVGTLQLLPYDAPSSVYRP